MKVGAAFSRAFRPLDTKCADEAITRYERSTRKLEAQARLTRKSVDCRDCGALVDAARRFTGQVVLSAGPVLRELFGSTVREEIPPDMLDLLGRLD